MKNKYLEIIEKKQIKKYIPIFYTGDLITVNIKIKENNKTRIQSFKGFVLSKKNRGINSSFIVRKISHGEGVERTFQTHSPIIEKIVLNKSSKVRSSKIYYMRERKGKKARLKEKLSKK